MDGLRYILCLVWRFEPSDWMPLPKALSHERNYLPLRRWLHWRRWVWVYRNQRGWCVNLLGRSWHVERLP